MPQALRIFIPQSAKIRNSQNQGIRSVTRSLVTCHLSLNYNEIVMDPHRRQYLLRFRNKDCYAMRIDSVRFPKKMRHVGIQNHTCLNLNQFTLFSVPDCQGSSLFIVYPSFHSFLFSSPHLPKLINDGHVYRYRNLQASIRWSRTRSRNYI